MTLEANDELYKISVKITTGGTPAAGPCVYRIKDNEASSGNPCVGGIKGVKTVESTWVGSNKEKTASRNNNIKRIGNITEKYQNIAATFANIIPRRGYGIVHVRPGFDASMILQQEDRRNNLVEPHTTINDNVVINRLAKPLRPMEIIPTIVHIGKQTMTQQNLGNTNNRRDTTISLCGRDHDTQVADWEKHYVDRYIRDHQHNRTKRQEAHHKQTQSGSKSSPNERSHNGCPLESDRYGRMICPY